MPALACPDCGAALHLALLPAVEEPQRAALFEAPARAPQAPPVDDPIPDFEESVRSYKRKLIRAALDQHGGVMTRAAKELGLKYTTFVAMVHRLELHEDDAAQRS